MKKTIPRILISAILLSLIAGIIVVIIGLILGWRTPAKFSDGFFWAGAILISLGLLNIRGQHSQPTASRLEYSQSVVQLAPAEQIKIWESDILHGYRLMAFLGISGLLLLGMSGLAIEAGGGF